jgi:acyl carrier protein
MGQSPEALIKEVMSDILGLEPTAIDASSSMESVESWDSANHVNLVLAIEESLGISFDVAEIEQATSYAELVRLVRSKS